MGVKSNLYILLNILARTIGLTFTIAGGYFFTLAVYSLIQPETVAVKDTLGFSPSFQPLVLAFVLLTVGVHFIRGEAHRPDLAGKKQSDKASAKRTRNWWTGESLENIRDRTTDT